MNCSETKESAWTNFKELIFLISSSQFNASSKPQLRQRLVHVVFSPGLWAAFNAYAFYDKQFSAEKQIVNQARVQT